MRSRRRTPKDGPGPTSWRIPPALLDWNANQGVSIDNPRNPPINGSAAKYWLDQRQGLEAEQQTGLYRPIWRNDNAAFKGAVLRFDGADDRMGANSSGPFGSADVGHTYYCVMQLDAITVGIDNSVVDFASGRSWVLGSGNAVTRPAMFIDGGYRTITVASLDTDAAVWAWRVAPGQGLQVFKNGVQIGGAGSAPTATPVLGGSFRIGSINNGTAAYLDGDLARLLCYTANHDDTLLMKISASLANAHIV